MVAFTRHAANSSPTSGLSKQVFVQVLIPSTPLEAFYEAIVQCCSWSDVVPLNGAILLPLKDGTGRHFRLSINNDHTWAAACSGDRVELSCNPLPRQRCIHQTSQARPAEVINSQGMRNRLPSERWSTRSREIVADRALRTFLIVRGGFPSNSPYYCPKLFAYSN